MPNPAITSTSNPRVKELARLFKRRERDATGRYLIEGAREVERAAAAGVPIDEVLFAPDLADRAKEDLADRLAGFLRVTTIGTAVASHLSRRAHPDGIIAVARSTRTGLIDLTLGIPPLLLVAEGIEKPGNLGAMLRTAEATGVDAVVAANTETDLTNPHVIRASQGAVFSVATAVCSAEELVNYLERNRVELFALTPRGGTSIWAADLTGSAAIAVGAEDRGLSPVLQAAGQPVRMPMAGAADSLNASVAAAVALYEAVRQRRFSRGTRRT